MTTDDDLLELIEDEPDNDRSQLPAAAAQWKVLVVDDDIDVHESTAFALQDLIIDERPVRLLHAYSAQEALDILRQEQEVAVILLDVVMETDDSGLRTVDAIRNDLGLATTRIILRTGQPGHAPEIDTIRRYDINDYKTKSELTRTKLYTTLTTAIRSFHQLSRLEANRRGLEKIIAASNQLIAEQGLASFAEGVILQLASLVDVPPEGLVCASMDDNDNEAPNRLKIIAAAGCYRHLIQHPIADIHDDRIIANLTQCLKERRNLISDHSVTFYFSGHQGAGYAAFIDSVQPLDDMERHLLKLFCTNIALCAKNVQLVSQLHEFAFVDSLLDMPNRTAFLQHLDTEAGKGRLENQTVALIDVDQFAETNDMFGHAYGDLLLGAIATRLHTHLASDQYVARVAGDTFAVVGNRDQINVQTLAAILAQPFTIEGVARPVSVCMGFAKATGIDEDGRELLKNASIALKRAKSRGQGMAETYTQMAGEESKEHMRLLQGIHQAFTDQRLFLVYQPQVNLLTNRVVGLEALLRWRTEQGELVPPGRFIPVAERSGLIVALGEWVLRSSLDAFGTIRRAGFDDLRLAVNVSLAQFKHPAILDMLDELLTENAVAHGWLELEITESVAIMGMNQVVALLKEIKKRQVDVALDDFGTGFSSLSYLDRLPIDRLKIDRSFISMLNSGPTGARIAETIVSLGQTLGIEVLAEGVEDCDQARILREIGCNEAQGFLFARPMPLDELLVWLTTRTKGLP